MMVTYIIPIKTYLAKYLNPKDGKIYLEGRDAIRFAFFDYAGYKITKREILKLYETKKLYLRIKPNQYPKKLISKYPINKYTYLKFTLPVNSKRRSEFMTNKSIEKTSDLSIKLINSGLEFMFWMDCVPAILSYRNTTLDIAITDFYSFYNLTDSDYSMQSFKTMLYKKKKTPFIRSFFDNQ